jgi:hypothetical protein
VSQVAEFSRRCIPPGVASPAASANVQPFLPASGEQPTHVGTGPTQWLNPEETRRDPREQLIRANDPGNQILISQRKIDNLYDHDHEVPLEYKASCCGVSAGCQVPLRRRCTPEVTAPSWLLKSSG